MRKAPFVVLACGNPSRGDDALGPTLLERLEIWLVRAGWAECFELIEDFQLQIEHALDLEGRRVALFVDAGVGMSAPFALERVPERVVPSHSTHAITPSGVLDVYRRTVDGAPPESWQLAVRGERFELGEGLSTQALLHLDAAWHAVEAFCHDVMVRHAAASC